jgi:uncharacterized lipoprotein
MKPVLVWIVRFSLASLLLSVFACSSPKPDYLKAETIPPVKVPEGLDNSRLGQLYRLPNQEIIEPTSAKTPFPPASATQASGQSASLQQLDNKLWVLNDRSVATTWVQLINFWNRRGVTLEKTDVKSATLQTGWFNEAIQPGFSIRYRLRLEQGFQDNTSEIYLTNQKRDDANLISEWTDNQNDVGDDRVHAQLIADSLVTQLINGQSDVGNSFLAESINLPQKSSVSVINNESVLLLAVKTQRAHKALSRVLTEDGFLTYDSDLAKGFFHFDQYEVGKKGFLSFLRSNKNSPEDSVPDKKSKYSVEQIIAHLPKDTSVNDLFFGDKTTERKDLSRLSGVPGFLLVVKPKDDSQLVYVRDGYGKILEGEEAKNILDVIRLRLF